MSIYSRARKHINMERVKELKEEKHIAELKKQQEIVLVELSKIQKENNKPYDWRTGKDLTEGMTTAALIPVSLDGEPDVIQTSIPDLTISSADNLGEPVDGAVNRTKKTQAIDASKTDTITINISGSFGSKVIPNFGNDPINDKVAVRVLTGKSFGVDQYDTLVSELGNGTHTISIPKRFQKANIIIGVSQGTAFQGGDGHQSGTVSVTAFGLKRVNSMKGVFVSLDDPDATAFIRDGVVDKLSPGEKKKKLEEQLKSSKEYLNKMFGEGMPNTATTIADYEPQQSFADIAQRDPYTDDDGANPFDPTYDKDTDELLDDSDFDPDTFEYAGDSSTKIAAGTGVRHQKFSDAAGSTRTRGQDALPVPNMKYDPHMKMMVPNFPKVEKKKSKQTTMVAHHEPQGKVIKEKKTLKDITKKIPGYYDGKPAPLGFPIVEPPKMKNGMHPDLVDGKKTAKRFNRLDPVSAKAMPKTGNPLIDKKVKAAAKKPK